LTAGTKLGRYEIRLNLGETESVKSNQKE
jgi:hypothetical protein